MRERRNGLIGRTSMLNERAGQFYKGVHCKVTGDVKTEGPNGLKNIDGLAIKQNLYS